MNASWSLEIVLDETRHAPIWRQIADAISDAIWAGRLVSGERLPGARTLAGRLGVHRNTVDAAYAELAAQGWVVATRGAGTHVAAALPARVSPAAARVDAQGFDWTPAPPAPLLGRPDPAAPAHVLTMAGGLPDLRLLPAAAIAQAYRRALLRAAPRLLTYAEPWGHGPLREQLATMLSHTRGLTLSAEQLIVTRGSQMGIALVAAALIRPGDRVAVEAMGYPPAWAALRAAGAELVPIRVDADGMDTEALEAAHQAAPLRAVYLTPHHQYPTTALLSGPRRVKLLTFAARERVAVVEDDYDHEFQYDGKPVLPLAAADESGVVVYVGTLSKVLAPGLRVGFVSASRPFVRSLAERRALWDRQGDQVTEAAVAELMESGELARHVRKMRRVYAERREVLASLLRAQLSGALCFTPPAGGMAIWASVQEAAGIDARGWSERAQARGVRVMDGSHYTFDGARSPGLRLGFACLTPDELERAVARLVSALP